MNFAITAVDPHCHTRGRRASLTTATCDLPPALLPSPSARPLFLQRCHVKCELLCSRLVGRRLVDNEGVAALARELEARPLVRTASTRLRGRAWGEKKAGPQRAIIHQFATPRQSRSPAYASPRALMQ